MAIRHVVLWRIGVDDAAMREQTITRFSERLGALVGVVPGLISLTCGSNSVAADGNWDMCLVADLQDEESLFGYQTHPEHMVVAKDIRNLATARAACDFTI